MASKTSEYVCENGACAYYVANGVQYTLAKLYGSPITRRR